MKRSLFGLGCVWVLLAQAAGAQSQALVTAGELYVNLDASSLTSGLSEGASVLSWANGGTTGAFVPVDSTKSATFQKRNGISVVRFPGTDWYCMTNGPLGSIPASAVGANTWTVEAWVFRPTVDSMATYFSTTPRAGLTDNSGKVAEFRYANDANNAVEHYGSDWNLGWGGPKNTSLSWPTAGEWHYLVCVRDAVQMETLYVDGRVVTQEFKVGLNLAADGCFTLGGVWYRDSKKFGNCFKGDIAQVRFMGGALTPQQVLNNFTVGNATFGRTSMQDALYTEGSWQDGVQPAAGKGILLDSSTALTLTADYALAGLRPWSGTLILDGGSDLAVPKENGHIFFGAGAGRTAELDIPSGSMAFTSFSGAYYLQFGCYGGTGTGVIGGRADASGALSFLVGGMEVGNEKGIGSITVATNGVLWAKDWLRIGDRSGSGTMSIEAGGSVLSCSDSIIGALSGTGTVNVAGSFVVSNTLYIGENSGVGTINVLPGGKVATTTLRPYNDAGTGNLSINGGTLQAVKSGTTIFTNVNFTVAAGGVTFDVGANVSGIVAANMQCLGSVVKTGDGTLIFADTGLATIAGDITVKGGMLVFAGASFPSGYSGKVLLENGSSFGIDAVGGIAKALACLDKASVGQLVIFGNNSAENIDLSGYPGVALAPRGVVTQTGTVTPYQNKYVFLPNDAFTYSGVIADIAGYPASVVVSGLTSTASCKLTGANVGMTGGVRVESGMLILSSASAAGSVGDIRLLAGTVIKLDAALGTDFLQNRVTADSRPSQIYVSSNGAACAVDLSRFPGCVLGDNDTDSVMTGAIIPYGTAYLLGGGNTAWFSAPNHGFQPSPLGDASDGTARQAVLCRQGLVDLSNSANSYSGGTVISNSTAAFVAGSDGFGKVPDEFDERNITVNGGIIRFGNGNVSLAATRGVYADTLGAELHPWGAYTFTILGGLTGTGPVKVTDGGFIVLAGAHNTYNGAMNLKNGLTIGSGDTYSWASTGGMSGSGTVTLNSNRDATFNDTLSESLALAKSGTGKVTLTKAQGNTGATTVNAGTLCLSGSGTLGSGNILNNGSIEVASGGYLSSLLGNGLLSGSGSLSFGNRATVTMDTGSLSKWNTTVGSGSTLVLNAPSSLTTEPITLDSGTLSLGQTGGSSVTGFAGWQCNDNASGAACALVATNSTLWLRLTDNANNRASTAFWTNRVEVSNPWTATFTYRTGAYNGPADGFAFILQNGSLTQVGSSGGTVGVDVFKPSVGTFINVYNNDSFGFILNGAKVNTINTANASFFQSGNVAFVVTYNGRGTLTQYATYNGTTVSASYSVNIAKTLGTGSAWIGFGGGTGGSRIEQYISDFTFTAGPGVSPISTGTWAINGTAAFSTQDNQAALFLTPNAGSKAGTAFYTNKVDVSRPFTLTATYKVGNHTSSPADGVAFIFQNGAVNLCGGSGGSMGYVSAVKPSVAWGLNLYPDADETSHQQCFRWGQNGAWVQNVLSIKDSGISLHSGTPVYVTIHYDLSHLTISIKQGENTATATQTETINLSSFLGSDTVWFGLGGGTGGSTAEQYVYNVRMAQDEALVSSSAYGAVDVEGVSSMNVLAKVAPAVAEVSEIRLADGAILAVSAATGSTSGLAYTLLADDVSLSGIAAVGTGDGGTMMFGKEVTFASTGVLTLSGTFAAKGKIVLHVPQFTGRRDLIDLGSATGLSLGDFALDTPSDGNPVQLRLVGGMLYAVHINGTMIQLN